ncbi:MAG: PP2C family protein-serine/threonine phosphatase [Tepidisphaeraceae bacterium]
MQVAAQPKASFSVDPPALPTDGLYDSDSLACIVPQAERSVSEAVEQLQEKIKHLSFELNLLRRRDETVHGMMQKLDEEQRLAARLQRDFLPKALPQLGQVYFQTLYRPAGYVSGDLYDVLRLDESHIGYYVADAVGHGMPAALLTMFMKNALVTKEISNGTYRLLEPAQTMARLNNSLCAQNLSHATFATAAYGTIDTRTLQLNFSTGGHPNPVLIRNGELIELKNDGALLGIFPDETFHNCQVQLTRGDRVFFYTDGIEVAFTDGDVADTERWRAELVRYAGRPLSESFDCITQQLDGEGGSLLPKDDLTIIAIEVR